MREIKFRVWDKKNKCWYKRELTFYGFGLFSENSLLCHPPAKDLQNLEISQFTGLKDREGKDVYEGDILIDDDTCLEVVRFSDKIDRDGYGWKCSGWEINLENARIIGNIYGNIYEPPVKKDAI